MSDNISANDIKYLPVELNGTIYDVPISSFFTEDNIKTAIDRINNEKKKKEKENSENPKDKAKNKNKIVVKLPSQTPGSVSSSPPPGSVSSSPPPGSLSASSPPFQTKSLSASPPPPPFYPGHTPISQNTPIFRNMISPPPYQFGWNLPMPMPMPIPMPMPMPMPIPIPIPQQQLKPQIVLQPQIILQPNNSINYETSDGLKLCKTHDDKWYYLYNNKWFYLTRDIGFIDKTDVRFTILRQPYGKYSYVNQI